MLGSIGGVGEGLHTMGVNTDVRSLARVATKVDLQVFKAGERFCAPVEGALVGLLPGVYPHVDQQLVPCVERPVPPLTRRPEAREIVPLPLVDVCLLDMSGQRLPTPKQRIAVHPPAVPRPVIIARGARASILTVWDCWG